MIDHPHVLASYNMIALNNDTFAIEVAIPDTQPTTVSGFDTLAQAEAWIARHKANIAAGSLKGAWSGTFKKRFSQPQ